MNNHEFLSAYGELEQRLYAFAMKLTRNRSDADDLLQETVIRAYSNRDKFQLGTNFKSWITTIMRNTFINNYRTRKRKNIVDGSLEDHTYAVESNIVPNNCESNLMMEELSSILNSVKPKYRIPFLMYYKGYEYSEIATEMSLPIGTVKSRLFTARQKLSALITNHYKEKKLIRA
ncbi:MAG: RNA polymerase sigma factor [Bacteroidota bacterium]